MKKLFFILMFIPFISMGQQKSNTNCIGDSTTSSKSRIEKEFKEADAVFFDKYKSIFVEWKKYIDDCNRLVPDTIHQSGTVKTKLVPNKLNGKVISYSIVPIDTVWNEYKCSNYKNYALYSPKMFINNGLGFTISQQERQLLISPGTSYTEPT